MKIKGFDVGIGDRTVCVHHVRLSAEAVRQRWPARNAVEAAFRGYNWEAADAAGWATDVNGERMRVIKTVLCTGVGCTYCAGAVDPDLIP